MTVGGRKRCDGCGIDDSPLAVFENSEYCPSCLKVRQQSDLAVREAFESAFSGVIAAARAQGIPNAEIIEIVARECTTDNEMELVQAAYVERVVAAAVGGPR